MPGLGLGSRLPVDTEWRLVERRPEKLHAHAPLADQRDILRRKEARK